MLQPVQPLSYFNFTFDNYLPASATYGALVTAGGSANTEGTPVVLATGAQLTQDCYWLEIEAINVSGTGDRQMLLDIGIDPAGSTAYVYSLANLVVGNASGANVVGGTSSRFLIPWLIKAGSQVAARVQCSQASITVRVGAKFYGQPSNPLVVPVGAIAETIGTITNSNGVSFTPGNATDGAWQSLGTTTNALWWWQLCYSVSNGTITAEQCYIELAYGDGSNKHVILKALHSGGTAETCTEFVAANRSVIQCYRPVPAGATIYVRGRCNNAPDTGYNAVALGIG